MDAIHRLIETLQREQVTHRLERIMVPTAAALFMIHLLLIWTRITFPEFPITSGMSTNYLSALYTPFSVILVYEVFLMILALPLSFNYSIRKQYEIITLVTIRNVFKDIAYFEDFSHLAEQTEQLLRVTVDLAGGLALFFMVGVFHHVSLYRVRPVAGRELSQFVRIKNLMTFLLLIVFVSLSGYSIYDWGTEVLGTLFFDRPFELDLHLIFFEDFYTVMIFADVLILIASFLYSRRYVTLVRNAGFVASAIFLRMSLAGEGYYGVGIAAFAILTGILAQLIHNYYHRLDNAGIRPIPTENRQGAGFDTSEKDASRKA